MQPNPPPFFFKWRDTAARLLISRGACTWKQSRNRSGRAGRLGMSHACAIAAWLRTDLTSLHYPSVPHWFSKRKEREIISICRSTIYLCSCRAAGPLPNRWTKLQAARSHQPKANKLMQGKAIIATDQQWHQPGLVFRKDQVRCRCVLAASRLPLEGGTGKSHPPISFSVVWVFVFKKYIIII